MAKIFLLKLTTPQEVSIFLEGDKLVDGAGDLLAVQVKELTVESGRGRLPLNPINISKDLLADEGNDNFHFKKISEPKDFIFELKAGVSISFLSLIAGISSDLSFSLKLFIPVTGSPNPPDKPFMQLSLCGRLAMFAGPLLNLDNQVCYELIVQDVPSFTPGELPPLPELSLRFPKFNFRLPKLRLPNWHLPKFPSLPFKLPTLRLEPLDGNALPFDVMWDSLSLSFDTVTKKTTLDVENLRISVKQLPSLVLSGDLRLVFTSDGKLVQDESFFKRREPKDDLKLKGLHADPQCFAVNWNEPHVNAWLSQLAPNLFAKDSEVKDITARVLFEDESVSEIRFDWSVAGKPNTFALPGLTVELPATARYTLLLRKEDGGLKRFALCATLAKEVKATVSSSFAWERGGERELHNDEADDPKPLFQLRATAQNELSLVVMDFKLGEAKLPKFLRQNIEVIPALVFADPASLSKKFKFDPQTIDQDLANNWDFNFKVNPDGLTKYALPFLRLRKLAGELIEQALALKELAKDIEDLLKNIDFKTQTIRFPLQLSVALGDLNLETVVLLELNWETFALKFNHDKGIELFSTEPKLPANDGSEVLGLKWAFRGRLVPGETLPVKNPATGAIEQKQKFHYFTLNTADHNYRLAQADNSHFKVLFTRASKEPIGFDITEFALMPKGINLTATVVDSPVRLNGIDTKFRFQGSQLVIRENQFNRLTLSGSGPLPPELVGEATASILLGFKADDDGNLTLHEGHAELKGQKLLKCQQTRFQFSIDVIEIDFKPIAGKFHLFFLLTGSAEFVPAPGDDANWALALLGKIKINLIKAPLAGDARQLLRKIEFLVNLPTPKSFNFLGCFEMELRGIGFIPQADVFDGDPAMTLTGQVKFAQGPGDTPDGRVNYHTMFIGLPEPGSLLPRIHFKDLPLNINLGAAFRLNGVIEFFDNPLEKGFSGEGVLQIQGLPTLAASFSFLRVREDENAPWLRAWFIFLEVRQVSFMIPILEIYIREVGLGFGYRYTIASIKKADEETDVRKLLAELTKLSRTQGDLSKRDRWAVDLEKGGQNPRWTVVLRALISQTTAAPSPLTYDAKKESELSCVFLFDAIIALRSDLTFFMAARAWLNTNYHDFFTNRNGISERPLLTGFVLLSPRQKRFLAHVASNPNGQLGEHPDLPDIVKKAIAGAQFSATLLIEPGLLHYELGWPNMLRWDGDIGGILKAQFRGGFIFRISRTELVIGSSYLARASLRIQAELDLGFFGVRVSAGADAAFGARYIGVVDFRDPLGQSALYGSIGLELRIFVQIEAWIHIELFLTSIDITFRLSVSIGFTAGLEIGLAGLSPSDWGLRGNGTLSLSVMGHDLHIGVHIGINEEKVSLARARTERFLQIGLEATEVESVPGIGPQDMMPRNGETSPAFAPATAAQPQPLPAASLGNETDSSATTSAETAATTAAPAGETETSPGSEATGAPTAAAAVKEFNVPGYSIFVIRKADKDGWKHFVLFPQGRKKVNGSETQETGFLPVPPAEVEKVKSDFEITFFDPNGKLKALERFNTKTDGAEGWMDIKPKDGKLISSCKVNWAAERVKSLGTGYDLSKKGQPVDLSNKKITLKDYLELAFIPKEEDDGKKLIPVSDPAPLPEAEAVKDARIQNPSDNAFEAAVRGALEQFEGSPFFKKDPKVEYEQLLDEAFQDHTTVYSADGQMPQVPDVDESTLTPEQKAKLQEIKDAQREVLQQQQAWQIRGMIVQEMIGDVNLHVAGALPDADRDKSVPFQTGLVFRFKGDDDALDGLKITLKQRNTRELTTPGALEVQARVFNLAALSFAINRPKLESLCFHSSASTIGIAWELKWNKNALPKDVSKDLPTAQIEPEHHLLHYRVVRECLGGAEPDAEYTVKNCAALHRRTDESLLKRLMWRFQIVDHFAKETAEDQIALPVEGRTYLYTITPVDFAGDAGESVTILATRQPDAPPLVPSDARLIVRYQLQRTDFVPVDIAGQQALPLLTPQKDQVEQVTVVWSQQSTTKEQATPAVAERWLVFRREQTLPIGSYGLDSATQRPRNKSLPTSNARPLPTDIKVKLGEISIKESDAGVGDAQQRLVEARVALAKLDKIFPAKDESSPAKDRPWRPEAWRVFMQTVSVNGVASALAPVQIQLELVPAGGVESDEHRDERRPAELEWLPKPARLPILPTEDQRAVTGTAHVPMPDHVSFTFPEDDFQLKARVRFRPHPERLRCIRFRWNQGPSGASSYPLELTAGYHLLELDADAHTTELFELPSVPEAALRTIQDVQMLPPDDLILTPNETLNTSQWEAWYPSSALRLKTLDDMRRERNTNPLRPWYSWRESYLEWPEWPGFTDAEGRRPTALHLFLQEFLYALTDDPLGRSSQSDNPAFFVNLLPPFNVDLQTSPPMQPGNLAAFFKATARKSDPYGWSILQRFGLAMAFSLRYGKKTIIKNQEGKPQERQEGEVVSGNELLSALRYVRKNYRREFLDLLLDQTAIDDLDTQLKEIIPDIKTSLSKLKDQRFYGRSQFEQALKQQLGEANLRRMIEKQTVAAVIAKAAQRHSQIKFEDFFKYLHFELLFQPGRSIELDENEQAVPESLLGLLQLSLRPAIKQNLFYGKLVINKETPGLTPEGEGVGGLSIRVRYAAAQELQLSIVNLAESNSSQSEISLTKDKSVETSFRIPASGEATLLLRGPSMPDVTVTFTLKEQLHEVKVKGIPLVRPTDEASGYFESAVDDLSALFLFKNEAQIKADEKDLSVEQAQWRRFKFYAESLNSTDKDVPEDSRIVVSLDKLDQIKETLPDYLAWSERFFDFSGEVKAPDKPEEPAQTGIGPWLATAYPRAGTPLSIAPDATGRLTYNHLIADDWAHNYRYFIRPYGRYEMLWEGLRRKDIFRAHEKALPPVLPGMEDGGLDVVLDREHPVAMPLVLSSRRLDAPSTPEKLAAPGKVWEVIVAEHEEQSLIERNQTLARQMSFRGIAFTMLRRFAFPDWKAELENAIGDGKPIELELIDGKFYAAPQAYPKTPENLDLSDEENLRSVALPERIRDFQQGALVLQWDALPFYYEHCLLLVAQTASNVSPVNQLLQKDFEYRTPKPQKALLEGSGSPPSGEDAKQRLTRVLSILLRPFWESLPEDAQKSWPSEEPGATAKDKRRLSSLPDREVVYQIFEVFSGNVEVQAEIFFGIEKKEDGAERLKYTHRTLGKRWKVDGVELLPRRAKLQGDPPTLKDDPQGDFIVAVTLEHNDEEITQETHLMLRPYVSARLEKLPDSLGNLVGFAEPKDYSLIWFGPMSPAEKDELLTKVKGDEPFRAALVRLSTKALTQGEDDVANETIPLSIEQLAIKVSDKSGRLSLLPAVGQPFNQLAWTGTLEDAQDKQLQAMAEQPFFGEAITRLREQINKRQESRVLPPGLAIDPPPPLLADQLKIEPEKVTWTRRVTGAQLAALKGLEKPPEYVAQIQDIVHDLETEPVSIDFSGMRRPEQKDLKDLRSKLLLGKEQLDVKALLTSDQARKLREAFTEDADRKAMRRFYRESVFGSLKRRFGSELKIRTRRGSAPVTKESEAPVILNEEP